jgi:photosystem II stability/assembly factor-like uncharacterized protein
MRAVDANTASYVWAVGDGGKILRYQSSAWSNKTSPTTANLRAVAVLNSTTVIVGGAGGALWRTTNTGTNWTAISATIYDINAIRFFDANKGVMVCNPGYIYYTTNGGVNWSLATGYDRLDSATDCCMTSATEAYYCSSWGNTYKSTNGGATWSLFNANGRNPWNGIDMKSGGYGWVAGEIHYAYGHACISRFNNNRRVTADVTCFDNRDTVYDVSTLSNNECWMVGKYGLILHLVNQSPQP